MKNLLKRFSHKNEKILRRELALAHSVIVLLSIGLVAVLLTVGGQTDIFFDQTLVSIACALLVIVAVVSTTITVAIAVVKSK